MEVCCFVFEAMCHCDILFTRCSASPVTLCGLIQLTISVPAQKTITHPRKELWKTARLFKLQASLPLLMLQRKISIQLHVLLFPCNMCDLSGQGSLFCTLLFLTRGVIVVGQMVQPPQAAESNGHQNEYFKWKKFIFCPQKVSSYWDQKKFKKMLFL